MEEQLETMESALDVERSICTHLSYGFDRSSAAWSEEDDEIVSFASDLELVMIGEALKAGNCIDAEDYEFLEELLPLEMCDFPETEEERERKAAIVVQREWRRYWRVKSWRCVKESVVKLQAFVRCKLQLTKYQRQRRQLIVLQSFLRKRRDTSKYQMALYSAYLIQSAWRRASVERSTLAVTSIQHPTRRWLVRSSYVHKLANAIRIQSAWRRWRQQRQFQRLLMVVVFVQSLARRIHQRRRYGRILASVLLVQQIAHGWLVRRQVKSSVSPSAPDAQDPVETKSVTGGCTQNLPNNPSKPTTQRASVEVIRSHHRALTLRRTQIPKFSDEWFYTTELLQGLEDELLLREREEESLEDTFDSRHDGPSVRDGAYSPGHVTRTVQSIDTQTSSRQLSLESSPISRHSSGANHSPGWVSFSSNNFPPSPNSAPTKDEETLKRLGLECVRLSRQLEELPRFSDEWFQTKVELEAVTDELEFLYSQLEINEARRSSC